MQDQKSKNSINNPKVAVGLSGGVDSSVAAFLLKQQGYDVTGVYIQCWDEKADGCSAEEDRASAASVAGHLEVKFRHLNFIKEYKELVIGYFYKEYAAGRTPNPDVMCNKEIKFGMFLDWAKSENFDYIATGHYARVENGMLLRGVDGSKDQSYFLYRIKKADLSNILFPLGALTKKEVRKVAKTAMLSTFNRPDSQGICFVGKVDIKEFLKKELPLKVGQVKHVSGEVIGEHDGVWFYTIGQRHGFKVNKYYGIPLYVVDKDIYANTLIVGFTQDVLKSDFSITDLHWLVDNIKFPLTCKVRVRNLGKMHDCIVNKHDDRKDSLRFSMKEETFGLAPGQSAVLYDNGAVLGGGIIE